MALIEKAKGNPQLQEKLRKFSEYELLPVEISEIKEETKPIGHS